MPKRKTQEQFLEDLEKKYPGKFDTSKVKYFNNKTNVILKCNDCGLEKEYRPDTLLKTIAVNGCFNCEFLKKRKRNKEKKLTEEELNKKIDTNLFEIDYSTYFSRQKPMKVFCKKCGRWFERDFEHLIRGYSCPFESARNRTTDIALSDIESVYPGIYDLSQTVYKNATEKMQLRCIKHDYIINVSYHTLMSTGLRKCCPKEWQSGANIFIKELLDKHNIENIPEYIFEDCKYIEPLRFDFYLPKLNKVIEYQGIFHYKDIYGELEKQQKRDNIKREYCLKNNIEEIEIPYITKDIEQTIIAKLNL